MPRWALPYERLWVWETSDSSRDSATLESLVLLRLKSDLSLRRDVEYQGWWVSRVFFGAEIDCILRWAGEHKAIGAITLKRCCDIELYPTIASGIA